MVAQATVLWGMARQKDMILKKENCSAMAEAEKVN